MSALQPQRSCKSATATTYPLSHYNLSPYHSDGSTNQNAVTETLQTELHWRKLTRNTATEVVIADQSADRYFDIGQSTPSRIVIKLPYAFIPSVFFWPVQSCVVALIETGCYERELIDVCKRSGAKYIECYSRTLLEPYIVNMDNAASLVA